MATIPRCSVFNGTVLPNMPEFDATVYPHWLIRKITTQNFYEWFASDQPFVVTDGKYVSVPEGTQVKGYYADVDSCSWIEGQATTNPSGGFAAICGIPGNSLYGYECLWNFMPIYSYSDPTVMVVGAGTLEDWDAETPTITSLTGAGTAESPTGYWKGDTTTTLTCDATVSDGGTLTYKWYKNGSLVGTGSSYTPPTNTAGQFGYYCIVTNTLTGDSGFSDIDTVQSEAMWIVVTAKEEPDTPDTPDTPVIPEVEKKSKPKHIIGYVLRLCGVPVAEMIAEMLCKTKKVVASHYLYGVPSESGNIGLRNGESVTYYDGAVLPKILEVEGCSCAFIEKPYLMRTWYNLFLTPAIAYGKTAEGKWCFGWASGSVSYALLDNEWKSPNEYAEGGLYGSPDTATLLWTNTDLLNEDGTVGRAGTAPIPVGEIVDTINNIPIYEDLR